MEEKIKSAFLTAIGRSTGNNFFFKGGLTAYDEWEENAECRVPTRPQVVLVDDTGSWVWRVIPSGNVKEGVL